MPDEKKIIAYKGFDMNLCCKGFQYEVGKEYKHDGDLRVCESGFHACKYPNDIFEFYPSATSRYCEVELSGRIESDDTKTVASKMRIIRELTINELCEAAVKYTQENTVENKDHNTGDWSISSNTLRYSSSSNTGDCGISGNTGDCGISSNTGDWSIAAVNGKDSIAIVEGENSVAVATGPDCTARATKPGSAIVLVERDEHWNIINIKCGIVGKDVEAGVTYKLVNGEFVAVT